MRGRSILELSQNHADMRCLDYYGNQPENDGTVILFTCIATLVVVLIIAGTLAYLRRETWNFAGGRCSYRRAGSLEAIYHHWSGQYQHYSAFLSMTMMMIFMTFDLISLRIKKLFDCIILLLTSFQLLRSFLSPPISVSSTRAECWCARFFLTLWLNFGEKLKSVNYYVSTGNTLVITIN